MTEQKKGWTLFFSALAVMLSLVANDIAKLSGWEEATQPPFVANVLLHISTVIAAFIGGKLIRSGEKK